MFSVQFFNNLTFRVGNMLAFSERSSSLGLGAFHGVVGIDFGELTIPPLILKSTFFCALMVSHLILQLSIYFHEKELP